MRIVAGEFRGRVLASPKGRGVRPTPDRVREAIFAVIAERVPGTHVLDLFAGTGAMGLEALSRGASLAVLVDQSRQAIRLIQTNVERLQVQDRVRVIRGESRKVVRELAAHGRRFGLIFLDPPYGKGLIDETLPHLEPVAAPKSLVIAEHGAGEPVPEQRGGWFLVQDRRYGDTAVWLFEKSGSQ